MAKAKQAKAPATEAMNVINKRFDPECAIGDITEHPRNAREGDVGALHVSIDHNGFYGALIVQESTGHILSGNHRYKAAVQKGAATIPVIWVDCDDAAALRIMVSDNRTSDIASYANDALAELLESIKIDETGLGFLGTGWDEEAYQNLLNDLSGGILGEESKAGLTEDDAVPDVPAEPVSKLGDLWILGNHRVLCGDSTNAKDVARLMDGARAHMVFTDPPYNVDYDPEARASYFSPERLKSKLGKIKNDKKSPEAFRKFLDAVYSNINQNVAEGRAIYICHADTEGHHFRSAFVAQPWKMQSCLIWRKSTLVFGRADYHWIHEPILYGWKDGASHVWTGDRKQTTVWDVATDHYNKAECDTDGYVHPTQKPVALIKIALDNSSSGGDEILDLFGGSGSTLIACEKTNRKARLMELDAKYVDVILTRWQLFTGQSATLDSDGRTFDEVKANGRAAATKPSV